MSIDVRDLELLEALGVETSLTRVAERLYVSQPALSQRLSRIEQRIGGPIFHRHGRRLVPNEVGERLLPGAARLLGELRALEHDAREIARNGNSRIRLATQCSTTFTWLTPVMHEFRELHPDATLAIESVPGDDLVDALNASRIDVAVLTKVDRQADRLTLRHLFDDEMVAVVAPSHPWTGRSHVTARDFVDQHVILYDSYDPARVPATPLPLPPGAAPKRLSTVPLVTDLVVELVASGDGISVLPNWVTPPYVERGQISIVRIGSRPAARRWYTATRPDEERSSALGLIDLLHTSLHGQRDGSRATAGRTLVGSDRKK